MTWWIAAGLAVLAFLGGLVMAFPLLLYGFHRPLTRDEARQKGSQLIAEARPSAAGGSVAAGKPGVAEERRVVAISAHPDDLECDAGGTLAKLAGQGAEIIAVIAADDSDRQAVRQREARAAGEVIGYRKVIFLSHRDGALNQVPREKLTSELAALLRQYRPDTVLTFDPVFENWIYKHPDHKAVGEAAVAAAEEADIPNVYLFFTGKPNAVVDITNTIDTKLNAWMAFESQQRAFPPFAARYFFSTAARIEGSKPGFRYGESFREAR